MQLRKQSTKYLDTLNQIFGAEYSLPTELLCGPPAELPSKLTIK